MAAETLLAPWAAVERDYRWLNEAVVKHYALRLLVLHDDADREFAYTTGAEDALDRAKTHGWTVVSMKEDWSAVFASA